MGGILEETRTMFDTFDERPFGPTDSLILSQLAYARMTDGVPRRGAGIVRFAPLTALLRAESYADMFRGVYSPERNVALVRAVCENPRWRNVRVGEYVDDTDPDSTLQFAACAFDLGDGTLYVAFRGTDSSFVGWKEDFMPAKIAAMHTRRRHSPPVSPNSAMASRADSAVDDLSMGTTLFTFPSESALK